MRHTSARWATSPASGSDEEFEAGLSRAPLWTIVFALLAATVATWVLRALRPTPVLLRAGQVGVTCGPLLWWVVRSVPRQGRPLGSLLGSWPSLWGAALTVAVTAANYCFGVANVRLSQVLRVPLATPDDLDLALAARPPLGQCLYVLAMLVFLGPITEELLFRGVLFRRWRATLGPAPALVLSSVTFGFLHPSHAVNAVVHGALLTLLYTSTRTLWVPLVSHIVSNALAIVPGLLWPEQPAAAEVLGVEFAAVTGLAVVLLGAFAGRAWSTLSVPLPPQVGSRSGQ